MYWHFQELDDEHKQLRRSALNQSGLISFAVPIMVLLISSQVRAHWSATAREKDAAPLGQMQWILWHRHFSSKFGSLGVCMTAAVYLCWQIFLAVQWSSQDYLHLTKAFGIIAASNLPLHFAMAGKSPNLLHNLLFRDWSYIDLNVFHQWTGRTIYLLAMAHSALYTFFFIRTERLTSRVQDLDVICGIIAISLLSLIYLTSIHSIRFRPGFYFRAFYLTHIIGATLIMPILWTHVTHLRFYLILAAMIWITDTTHRWFSTRWGYGVVVKVEASRLLQLTVTLPATEMFHLEPGSHIFITIPSLGGVSGSLRANPFTVSSASVDQDHNMQFHLIMTVRSGLTKQLMGVLNRNEYSEDMNGHGPTLPVAVFVPSQMKIPSLRTFERILIIAGGVGGTFCMPLARRIVSRSSQTRRSFRFIWSVRHPAEISWAFPTPVVDHMDSPNNHLELFVTEQKSMEQSRLMDEFGEEEDIALHPTINASLEAEASPSGHCISRHYKRPDLASIIAREVHECGANGKLAIVLCGPAPMAFVVKKHVGHWISQGAAIWFWEEGFGY